ncbi:MAG: cell wall metabolism sensor histidine kinase WalK [bacterium]|nr:cell wall metabolism sensor histidine kinase WalK [bacterium]
MSAEESKWEYEIKAVKRPGIRLSSKLLRVAVRIIGEEDELGLLTDAFNSMLIRIEERDSTLRSLRNLLGNIINSMPSALVGVDRDGRVTQWNREAVNITGVSTTRECQKCGVKAPKYNRSCSIS